MTLQSSKLRILTKRAIWTNCNPKQFVTNDHRFQILRPFDVIGCFGGSGRRGVSIPVSFRTRNACWESVEGCLWFKILSVDCVEVKKVLECAGSKRGRHWSKIDRNLDKNDVRTPDNTGECYWDHHCGQEKIQSDCVSSSSGPTKSQTGEKRTGFLKKWWRDSNVRRGEDAVETRLESEEKPKKSGETLKTYKN